MKIELVPDPGADDPVARAAVAALWGTGLVERESRFGSVGGWGRVGRQEAIERSVIEPSGAAGDSARDGCLERVYAPPARSNRGALRA